MTHSEIHKPKIGLALGSGSARGWSHIGVIQALEKIGIVPDIIAGSSIGALVGAAYASNQLDKFDDWARSLTWKEILKFIDLTVTGGGFIQGNKLFEFASKHIQDDAIESLAVQFGMVATELDTGREIWFQQGPILKPLRASIALPGIFTPVKIDGRWLVDGGLSNPVPVSLCRAMGADIVIAVNLNGDIVGKHTRNQNNKKENTEINKIQKENDLWQRVSTQFKNTLNERKDNLLTDLFGDNHDAPGLFNVLVGSINIMQDRITRSRMAGDPPDIILSPQLSELGLMELDQAATAIKEGKACVQRMRPVLEKIIY